jgi:hypothetical protein
MHIKSDEYEEADKVFNHDKTYSTIYGKLTTETFYGPPGFGEDPINDEKVKQYILVLEEDPFEDHPKMQIEYVGNMDLTKFLNKKVRVSGTFFSSLTGYHNTPILIDAKNIEEAE